MCHRGGGFRCPDRQTRQPISGNPARTGSPASFPTGRAVTARPHVDFAECRPYRTCMIQEPESGAGPITLTPRAIEMVKTIRAKEGFTEAHVLRVSVVGGGCSGFSYQLDFDQGTQQGDHVIEVDGVRVVVDPTSAEHLAGTEIDYVSSLHGGGFKFHNPKATQTCGCGSSFSA